MSAASAGFHIGDSGAPGIWSWSERVRIKPLIPSRCSFLVTVALRFAGRRWRASRRHLVEQLPDQSERIGAQDSKRRSGGLRGGCLALDGRARIVSLDGRARIVSGRHRTRD